MINIELGEYTKEQLFSIIGNKDLSNIKRDLTKYGYSYTTNSKRGSNYRLIINAVPKSNKNYDTFCKICKSELNIIENIDFNKFAILICFLEYDTNFVNLTLESMEYRIKEVGFIISRKTISKYLDILKKNNILVSFINYVYYIPLEKTKFITKDQWEVFWHLFYNNFGCLDYLELLDTLGGIPRKKNEMYFGNALIPAYKALVKSATALVKQEVNNNVWTCFY